jgi:hypothetical protein
MGATGVSDMAGKAARAAVEGCGKQPRYNPHAQPSSIRVQREFGTLRTLNVKRTVVAAMVPALSLSNGVSRTLVEWPYYLS